MRAMKVSRIIAGIDSASGSEARRAVRAAVTPLGVPVGASVRGFSALARSAAIALAASCLAGALPLPGLTNRLDAGAVTYDATKDFSVASNPNGVWTYGYETTGGSPLIPYTAKTSNAWLGNLSGNPGDPVIWFNNTGNWILNVAPGQLVLHPGPSAQPCVLRWTAPSGISPLISVVGQFFPGDYGSMQVGIFLNNDWATPLFQATDSGSFSFSRSVTAGDTIDFAVYGAYYSGSTPLDAVITASSNAVPEIDPAGLGSVLALVTGALGLIERRRKTVRPVVCRLLATSALLSLALGSNSANAGPMYSFGGHSYFLTSGASTWTNAQLAAVSAGGNLVTINTIAEQNFLISTFLSGADATTQSYWIGINDQATEGVFVWASGEPVSYTNWEAGEPNDYAGGEDFGALNWHRARAGWGSVGSWNDTPDVGSFGLPLVGIVEVATSSVPEIDPAGMGSVLALVTGALGLIERRGRGRGRRCVREWRSTSAFQRRPRGRNEWRAAWEAAALMVLPCGTPHAAAATIDWVTIGDAGNAAHAAGYGAVGYEYRIMKYEWTNARYVEFLNAVDPQGTNPSAIYHSNMGSSGRGGITNTGSVDGSRYASKPNMADKPVNFVSWFDAARVANWLHNGGQTYATSTTGSAAIQSGAYALNGAVSGAAPTRAAAATFWVPTLSEWFKAGWYRGGGTNSGYWAFATQSDAVPAMVGADASGIGSAGASGNFANYGNAADWNSQDGNVTTVGTNGGPSAYGVFDLGGNIEEWNDRSGVPSVNRGIGGGSWSSGSGSLGTAGLGTLTATAHFEYWGFRLARSSVPEIDPAGMGSVLALVTGALGLIERGGRGRGRRCVRKIHPSESTAVAGGPSWARGRSHTTTPGHMAFRSAGGMALALAVTLAACAPARATPVEWTVASGGNGHFYDRIEQTGLTFTAARDAAATLSYLGLPGRLVVFETSLYASELAFVNDNVYAPGVQTNRVYCVGASSPNGFDPWTWIDGSTVPTSITATWRLDRAEGPGAEGIHFFQPGTTLWDYLESNPLELRFGLRRRVSALHRSRDRPRRDGLGARAGDGRRRPHRAEAAEGKGRLSRSRRAARRSGGAGSRKGLLPRRP